MPRVIDSVTSAASRTMSVWISSSCWWNPLRTSIVDLPRPGRVSAPRRRGGRLAGDQVAQAGADDRGVVGDAFERLARPPAYGSRYAPRADRSGRWSSASSRSSAGWRSTARGQERPWPGRASRARPGPHGRAVPLDGLVGQASNRSKVARLAASSSCSGASLTTRRARSPIRSSSPDTRSTDTMRRRSEATGCLARQQDVAALGERHVHGVDVVVGVERLRRGPQVAGAQHVAHAVRGSGRPAPP